MIEPSCAVLGSGIAGLLTALELERLGMSVEVYEADERCGGRVLTHTFTGADGRETTVDLGAMRIPREHRRTLDLIASTGLADQLRPFHSMLGLGDNLLRIGDDFVRARDATPRLAAATAQLVPGAPHDPAALAVAGWFLAVVDAIGPAELRALVRHDLPSVVAAATRLDLSPFVRGAAVDLRGAMRTHPEIIAACGLRLRSFGQDIVTEYSNTMYRLRGGMTRLVDGVRAQLRGPVRLGNVVRSLRVEDDHVSLGIDGPDGPVTRTHALAVCTLPFSVLRSIPVVGLSSDKLAAVAELDYGSATKVAFHTARPFWRDHGIHGGASATGGLSRQTYYSPDPTGPGALLASYTIAEDADVLGRMPPEQRHHVVRREVAAMHPELDVAGMVLDASSRAWGEHPWSNGCAARRWSDDDAGRRQEARRAARPERALYFAGEHCSIRPAWIEAAVDSAHRVVREIWDDRLRRSVG